MFTGIITAKKEIVRIEDQDGNRLVSIALPEGWNLEIGESVNVSGICSTVIAVTEEAFDVEYMPETLQLTTMGQAHEGATVNLERSITLQDVLSGHMVSGHVDTTGVIEAIDQDGSDSYRMRVQHNTPQYVIQKGSVTLNGVSLTVIDPTEKTFTVAIIPHTWQHTNLSNLSIGDSVNIEYDMIAKYIERLQQYG